MSYLEPSFFFFVLAVVIGRLLFARRPKNLRLYFCLVSIGFLASWNWLAPVVYLLNALFIFFWAIWLEASNRRKLSLSIGILVQVGLLVFFRAVRPSSLLGVYEGRDSEDVAVVGLAFVVLQNISYLVDIYWKVVSADRSIVRVLLYAVYFPKVLVGPLQGYRDFQRTFECPTTPSGLDKLRAIYWIAFGVFKCLVVSRTAIDFYRMTESQYGASSSIAKSVFYFFIVAVMSWVVAYVDFSGLASIGRGVSLLLGIPLPSNFNRPYLARGASDYWNRWHISLGHWMKRYVFFPTLIASKNAMSAIFVTMAAVAVWHGFYTEMALWAFMWGGLLSAQAGLSRFRIGVVGAGPKWRTAYRLLSIVLTFIFSCTVGLLTSHQLFFNERLPGRLSAIDELVIRAIQSSPKVWAFILLVIAGEFFESRIERSGSRHRALGYASMALLFVFLLAAFVSGDSYLFYYLRL